MNVSQEGDIIIHELKQTKKNPSNITNIAFSPERLFDNFISPAMRVSQHEFV